MKGCINYGLCTTVWNNTTDEKYKIKGVGQSFWSEMLANPLLFVAVALTIGVILVNGWTDAPNAIATCVSTRCLSPKKSIIMAAIFNFLGVLIITFVSSKS